MFIKEHVAYILGYPDGDMRPNDYVTRAEVATVFYRLLADDVRMAYWTLENPFADVEPGDWYNAAISVICSMEIIKGYFDGTFAPDDLITRGELATVAARFAGRMGLSGAKETFFTDIQGHWAAADVGNAGRLGWVNGYPDMTFMPDNFITRAEFITLVNNILERIPETASDVLSGDMRVWNDNMDADEWYYLAVQEATNTHSSEPKAGLVIPGRQFEYERWTGILGNPDWPQLEKQWIAKYSANQ